MRVSLSTDAVKLPAGLTVPFLRSLVRETCVSALPLVFARKERGAKLELVFATDAEIRKLNREYRSKDSPTDVLSFGEFATPKAVAQSNDTTLDLGTLVVSLPFVRRSAKEDGVSWEREFVFVFVHGVLHLLGFDHGKKMFVLQDQLTDTLSPVPPKKKKK